eukprot:7130105-Prymnesium_polylepis.1
MSETNVRSNARTHEIEPPQRHSAVVLLSKASYSRVWLVPSRMRYQSMAMCCTAAAAARTSIRVSGQWRRVGRPACDHRAG